MNDIILEVQMELEQEGGRSGKHIMAINKNIAIGIMKDQEPRVCSQENTQTREREVTSRRSRKSLLSWGLLCSKTIFQLYTTEKENTLEWKSANSYDSF